jgi:hypothetical protein
MPNVLPESSERTLFLYFTVTCWRFGYEKIALLAQQIDMM